MGYLRLLKLYAMYLVGGYLSGALLLHCISCLRDFTFVFMNPFSLLAVLGLYAWGASAEWRNQVQVETASLIVGVATFALFFYTILLPLTG